MSDHELMIHYLLILFSIWFFSPQCEAKLKDVIRVKISRKEMSYLKKNISELLDSVEIKPQVDRMGNHVGIKIISIKQESFLNKMGFKMGDIILQDPFNESPLPIIGVIYETQHRIYIKRNGEIYLIRTNITE